MIMIMVMVMVMVMVLINSISPYQTSLCKATRLVSNDWTERWIEGGFDYRQEGRKEKIRFRHENLMQCCDDELVS